MYVYRILILKIQTLRIHIEFWKFMKERLNFRQTGNFREAFIPPGNGTAIGIIFSSSLKLIILYSFYIFDQLGSCQLQNFCVWHTISSFVSYLTWIIVYFISLSGIEKKWSLIRI